MVIYINLTSTFNLTRSLLPPVKHDGWGRFIFLGSGSLFEGVAGQAHYVSAKAGVVGFARSIARELGSRPSASSVPASATKSRKIWSEPCSSWLHPTQISSPDTS